MMPTAKYKFREPPPGKEIVNLIHGIWKDWYWKDADRDLLVYIVTEPAKPWEL